jgi:hypothetical protein
MNSIARALNNIALSITQLTAAVASATAKKIEESTLPSKTETSNGGGGHVTVTAITTSQPTSPKIDFPKNYKDTYPYDKKDPYSKIVDPVIRKALVFKEEKDALDAIFTAITDKGINPKHHDKMMKQLREGWPVLYKALMSLIAAHDKHYNPSSSRYYAKDIWKASHNKWDK